MTTDQDLQPVRIGGGASDRNTEHDRFPFYLGDDDTVLIGTRPKIAVLLRLATVMDDDSQPMVQAAAFGEMLEKVLDADSHTYITARLEDDDDDLDLDHPDVQAMFKTLVEVWYGGRPTGGRRGAASSSSRTGKRSTVRRRSQG